MRALLLPLLLVLTACSAPRQGPDAARAAMSQHEVAVAGGTIHVEALGSGETVLLLHGAFGDRRMWDGQITALARKYRVARIDLRGWGRSSMPTAAYSPVADVIAVLDELGAKRAHLVGNSMGGALVIDVALAHPERVASLTVVASGPNGFPASPEDRARFAGDIEDIVAVFRAVGEQGVEHAVALWKEHPMVAVAHADPAVAPQLHRMIDENPGMLTLQHWPDDDKSAVGKLAQIRAATLIVVGDRDIGMVRAAAAFAARAIAGATLVTIPGTDHLPQMEQPERFNRLLLDFLARHPVADP